MKKMIALAGFLACILAANFATTRYGMVPVGFGLVATAGTYFAGLSFVMRDTLQDAAGKRWAVGGILAGTALSFAIADPFIAIASAVAFGLSELIDFGIYTPLRKRGYIRAALASNIVGSFIDTVAFLAIAGFPILSSIPGQMAAKVAITVATVAGYAVWKTRRTPAVA